MRWSGWFARLIVSTYGCFVVLALLAWSAIAMPGEHAVAARTGRVFINQPLPKSGGVRATMHTYAEGPSGLNPVDVSKGGPGGQTVYIDIWGLPRGSSVRFDGYNNNNTGCSANSLSGDRYILDIWVTPPGRQERYLGYTLLQHTQNNYIGGWTIRDTDNDGRITDWTGKVWDGPDGRNIYNSSGRLCWTGDHVHQAVSRDYGYEATHGSSTTGIGQIHAAGASVEVTYKQGLYYFDVDWDTIHY